MGDPVVTNIITGGAVLWNAPVAEPLPDESTVFVGAAWGGNWERVGFTKAPVTMAYELEEMEVEVEEYLAPLKRIKIKEGAMIETVLAELTSEYLALAFSAGQVTTVAAGVGQRAYDEIGVGGQVFLDEKVWGIEGTYIDAAGDQFPVRLFLWKATTTMNGSLTFSNRNGEYPGIPFQIKTLADPSQPAGQNLFKFQRVTAKATDE